MSLFDPRLVNASATTAIKNEVLKFMFLLFGTTEGYCSAGGSREESGTKCKRASAENLTFVL
jgi:hypothetical protein